MSIKEFFSERADAFIETIIILPSIFMLLFAMLEFNHWIGYIHKNINLSEIASIYIFKGEDYNTIRDTLKGINEEVKIIKDYSNVNIGKPGDKKSIGDMFGAVSDGGNYKAGADYQTGGIGQQVLNIINAIIGIKGVTVSYKLRRETMLPFVRDILYSYDMNITNTVYVCPEE